VGILCNEGLAVRKNLVFIILVRMANKPAKQSERIRWPTAAVILVLATIGFFILWQVLLVGGLSRQTPEEIVREVLRLGMPHPESLEINEVTMLYELTGQGQYERSAVLRVRFRAKDDLGHTKSFDKIFVVVGEQVKSSEDWTPELESQVHTIMEKRKKK
jgi:hypothetical protein